MLNTRQGAARPARFKHIPHNLPDSPETYAEDSARRAATHAGFWDREPLTPWQEFILCRELDCSRRPRFSRGVCLRPEEALR